MAISINGVRPGASAFRAPSVSARRALVTIGTGANVTALGRNAAHKAGMVGNKNFVGFSAIDAGHVKIAPGSTFRNPLFQLPDGTPVTNEEILKRWPSLLESTGIRFLNSPKTISHTPTRIAARLAHGLERGYAEGGLTQMSGLDQPNVERSVFEMMYRLFFNVEELHPSLQAQMILYAGMLATAALPGPLSSMLSNAILFRIASGLCFFGQDRFETMKTGFFGDIVQQVIAYLKKLALKYFKGGDEYANRLANSLSTQGPALLNTFLATGLSFRSVSKAEKKGIDLRERLKQNGSGLSNVPQAPLVSNGACAAMLIALSDIADQMVAGRRRSPRVVLLTGGDAALEPDDRVLDGFGDKAMVTEENLKASGRHVSQSLAPFDKDASGTVVGHGGGGIIITDLEFALEHGLDITGLLVGWGQSGETGYKEHLAGVGYGGNNALKFALMDAYEDHGFGIADFDYDEEHGTGTSTNSKTGLDSTNEARREAAKKEGYSGKLPDVKVGAPKAAGPGHTMGHTGMIALEQGIQYILGEQAVGVPTFKTLDPEIASSAEGYILGPEPVRNERGLGAFMAVQGFGGYNGAAALMPANPETISRYAMENPALRDQYLERWADIRRAREQSEFDWSTGERPLLELAAMHRWPGIDWEK